MLTYSILNLSALNRQFQPWFYFFPTFDNFLAGLRFRKEVCQRRARVDLPFRANLWPQPWPPSSSSNFNSFRCNSSNKISEHRYLTSISTKRIWVICFFSLCCSISCYLQEQCFPTRGPSKPDLFFKGIKTILWAILDQICSTKFYIFEPISRTKSKDICCS